MISPEISKIFIINYFFEKKNIYLSKFITENNESNKLIIFIKNINNDEIFQDIIINTKVNQL